MSDRKFQPLMDRVLIEKLVTEETTPGSLVVVPEIVRDNEQFIQGKVLAHGPGRVESGILVPITIQVGDIVLFNRLSIMNVKVDGLPHSIINERDILAIL